MSPLLVEPSLYVYAEKTGDTFERKSFDAFWATFEKFRKLVETNDSRVFLSADIRSAITELFPYSLLGSPESRKVSSGNPYTAAVMIIRFLDKYAIRPFRDYAGYENITIEKELFRQPPVYTDDNVWLAWRDLLGQISIEWNEKARQVNELLSADEKVSCIGTECKTITVSSSGKDSIEIPICRIANGEIPEFHIDPKVIDDLIKERRKSGLLSFSYEDSGHQPSREIKKVLQRTAQEVENIVIRMNTTYRNPNSTLPCKLFLDEDFNKVGFRITDGTEVVKGFFTTAAQSIAEQQAALQYIQRVFRYRCGLSSLPYTSE